MPPLLQQYRTADSGLACRQRSYIIQCSLNTLGIIPFGRRDNHQYGRIRDICVASHVATVGEIRDHVTVLVGLVDKPAIVTDEKELGFCDILSTHRDGKANRDSKNNCVKTLPQAYTPDVYACEPACRFDAAKVFKRVCCQYCH